MADLHFKISHCYISHYFLAQDIAQAEQARQENFVKGGDSARPNKPIYTFTVGGFVPPDRPFFLYHGAVLSCGNDSKQKFRVLGSIMNASKKTASFKNKGHEPIDIKATRDGALGPATYDKATKQSVGSGSTVINNLARVYVTRVLLTS